MSKVSFRCKPVDTNRPMPVFDAADLPDLSEYAAINRSQPSMPTGMEKDEEMELHLQRVLSSQQATCSGVLDAEQVVIPTPRVISDVQAYQDVYHTSYKHPPNIIKVEASLGFEPEVAEYDCDSEDESWLCTQSQHNAPVDSRTFETIMDRLETASLRQVVKLCEARSLLQELDNDVVQNVYDYWIQKRLRQKQPLVHRVRTDKLLGANDQPQSTNPYLAFRRRAEKMQTRKNRKNDEDSYEKILKLSHDLRKAVTLLDMVKHRELSKRELIRLDSEVTENRVDCHDYDGRVYSQALSDAKPTFRFKEHSSSLGKRKRKHKNSSRQQLWPLSANNQGSDAEDSDATNGSCNKADRTLAALRHNLHKFNDEFNRPLGFANASQHQSPLLNTHNRATASSEQSIDHLLSSDLTDSSASLDGQFAFKRKRGCQYYAPLPAQASTSAAAQRLCPTAAFYPTLLRSRHNARPTCVGLARRRVGRGGRILYDRHSAAPVPLQQDEGLESDSEEPSPTVEWDSLSAVRNSSVLYAQHSTRDRPAANANAAAAAAHTTIHTGHINRHQYAAAYREHVNSAGTGLTVLTQHSSDVYYRPRSSSGQRAMLDHDYCIRAPGWPTQRLMDAADGLRPDSGYSSPVDHRSRSLVNSSRLTRSQQELGSVDAIAHDKHWATLHTKHGRPLNVPYRVGVSARMYTSHQSLLAQSWQSARPCTSQTGSQCCRAQPAEQSPTGAPHIDRYQAVHSAGAVHKSDFVHSLWQQHNKQQQPVQLNGLNCAAAADPHKQNNHLQQNGTDTSTYALPTPSPSPNSPQSDDSSQHHHHHEHNKNNSSKYKPHTHSPFLALTATALVEKTHANNNGHHHHHHRPKLNGRRDQFSEREPASATVAENSANTGTVR